ncbi:hypothetical protein [Paraburkholderia saeva]|uniref:Uncharacterized protein n=1 Tax=Paraburkholderia saeva TaxID=2777537 RepID=A0A9N8RZQ9_9BURK|nr:hypothetical protein [Paraburkholderia saeva]CAG4919284.1 hypothetical protein LMG31841_04862 [Paraburkholderia saeva]
MNDSVKIGRRACDAAMEAADKMESLFSAIERLADDDADKATMSGLAGIGRAIATELSTRMDNDETALMRLDRSPGEAPGTS